MNEFKSNERLMPNGLSREAADSSKDITNGASKNLLFHDSEGKNLYKRQDDMLMSVWWVLGLT